MISQGCSSQGQRQPPHLVDGHSQPFLVVLQEGKHDRRVLCKFIFLHFHVLILAFGLCLFIPHVDSFHPLLGWCPGIYELVHTIKICLPFFFFFSITVRLCGLESSTTSAAFTSGVLGAAIMPICRTLARRSSSRKSLQHTRPS